MQMTEGNAEGEIMAAEEATSEIGQVKSRSGRSRPDGSRRKGNPELTRKYLALKKRHKELERLFLASTIGLVVLCFILGGWAFKATSNHRSALHSRYLESAALAEAKAQLKTTRGELATLIEGRIPNLHVFKADEVIPIEQSYLRNISFTEMRKNDIPVYEYKLVTHNETDIMLTPRATILMFDELGVEIGRSSVPPHMSDGPVTDHTLYPDEVQSYAAAIEIAPEASPSYFKLDVD